MRCENVNRRTDYEGVERTSAQAVIAAPAARRPLSELPSCQRAGDPPWTVWPFVLLSRGAQQHKRHTPNFRQSLLGFIEANVYNNNKTLCSCFKIYKICALLIFQLRFQLFKWFFTFSGCASKFCPAFSSGFSGCFFPLGIPTFAPLQSTLETTKSAS